jgi:two-component system NtrC family sensor kinase
MNKDLQLLKDTIEQSESLTEAEKELLLNSIKAVNKELTIVEFKLQRTEKVKRTTSVLLEETIDELEKKREDVEKSNSALKKSLADLKATQSQLIQSEKMASLGELTAGIAHEIQNPLNFVNNFAEVSADIIEEMNEELENGNLHEVKEIANDIKQNLEKINHHGKRASGIVKGMLEHSRTTNNKKEITDINAMADEFIRLAYHGMRAKDKSFQSDFKVDLDDKLPKINTISQDIGRVLLNLINNAFYAVNKRSKENIEDYKPIVSIHTKQLKNQIEIKVSDNGNGIPDKIKNKIFQPFFTTKPTGSGTGLGLSLSYDIVKAHGGKIAVESVENEGTKFIIQLPLKT